MRKIVNNKVVAAALAAVCMASMAACGSSQGTNSTAATQQAAQSAGYVFETKGTKIEINGKVADYTAKLGEPAGGYYEAKSCAFDGMDKFYYYDSFTLQAYQKDNTDVVYSVQLLDDTVKTAEGVKIGDSKDKMVSAYGSNYKETSGQFVYTSGNMTLAFTIQGDVIQSIDYTLAN